MKENFFINTLDLERATKVTDTDTSEVKSDILDEAKSFGIDEVYFCDEFPAIFIKIVPNFLLDTLKELAEIHHNVWNYKKVLQLYVISDLEIRIYNCSEMPIYLTDNTDYQKETQNIELYRCLSTDKEKITLLNKVFSRIAIDTGLIWTLEEAKEIKSKINLQKRVDKYLVSSLINVAEKLKSNGLSDIDLIHKLIMRSLFLLFLEDRDATDDLFYKSIKPNSKSYFDILTDLDSTYNLYEKLETHFKGNIFQISENEKSLVKISDLDIIKKCFIAGFDSINQNTLFEDWRLFNFKIIQIELLSEIYENFLSEIDAKKKEETGTFYTPPSLVELILNHKLPINGEDSSYNIKILDPACGSGIFLVESFKRLIKRYEKANNRKLTNYEDLKKLLTDNIFGIEIDTKSIKVTAFSLYLALLENLNPKTLWQKKELPNLINDPDDPSLSIQGFNLYRRDTIQTNQDIENIEFDLVIGNPPFGTKKLSTSIRNYCDKHGFAKEMVLPFLHKSIKFSPKGEIALIFNTKVLTNTNKTYKKFRHWLFNECYVEKIFNFSILRKTPKNLGGQLFGSAVGPISILFFKKESPQNPSDKIIYYAPKTYMKMDVLEGIVIDATDVKYLPRDECQKVDTKIWKVAMWGGMNDISLINKLDSLPNFLKFIGKNSMKKGLGLQFLDNSTKDPKIDNTIPTNYLSPQNIERYFSNSFININGGLTLQSKKHYSNYYNVDLLNIPPINVFRRLGAKDVYVLPHMVVKEGLKNWRICASYISENCSFNSKVLGLTHNNPAVLKGITCFLNSNLAYYYLFMVSASIGIEREEIKPNEIYDLPFILTEEQLIELSKVYDENINLDSLMFTDLTEFENKIDKLIYEYFKISEKDQILISDAVKLTFPLLFKGSKSNAVKNSTTKEILEYLNILVSELNDFLTEADINTSATAYSINKSNPLSMVKLCFGEKTGITGSNENVNKELNSLDKKLFKKESDNIFFRKKLNYYDGNEIFIIKPNQRRFWSQSSAIEDSMDLIVEILNMQ